MSKREGLLNHRDMNQILKKRKLARPEEDSPGDTAEDEMTETFIGTNYPETEDRPDDILADTPAEIEDDTEEFPETPNERTQVTSSKRPDPINDLDAPSSIH